MKGAFGSFQKSCLDNGEHFKTPDLRRGDLAEWDEVLAEIAQVKFWDKDPVTGKKE
ncbi:MAG: hypothetical protein ACOX1T_00475 [Saccharofermentanales bacterium]|jgi:uncharacterized protein YjlB